MFLFNASKVFCRAALEPSLPIWLTYNRSETPSGICIIVLASESLSTTIKSASKISHKGPQIHISIIFTNSWSTLFANWLVRRDATANLSVELYHSRIYGMHSNQCETHRKTEAMLTTEKDKLTRADAFSSVLNHTQLGFRSDPPGVPPGPLVFRRTTFARPLFFVWEASYKKICKK